MHASPSLMQGGTSGPPSVARISISHRLLAPKTACTSCVLRRRIAHLLTLAAKMILRRRKTRGNATPTAAGYLFRRTRRHQMLYWKTEGRQHA